MPTWKALIEASCDAAVNSACSPGGRPGTRSSASGWLFASSTAAAICGLRAAWLPSSSSSCEPNEAATTAPTPAIAMRLATRAIALFTPEAMPALLSSASASTVAVSGATVIDSPSANTSSPGSRSEK